MGHEIPKKLNIPKLVVFSLAKHVWVSLRLTCLSHEVCQNLSNQKETNYKTNLRTLMQVLTRIGWALGPCNKNVFGSDRSPRRGDLVRACRRSPPPVCRPPPPVCRSPPLKWHIPQMVLKWGVQEGVLRRGCSGGGAQEGVLRRECSVGGAQEGVLKRGRLGGSAQEEVLKRGCSGGGAP